jgi:hypothetical protein
MCANSYDECGPTIRGRCPQQCKSNARAGSILSGAQYPSDEDAVVGEELSSGGVDQLPGKVLSVTDKKAERPTLATPPAGAVPTPEAGAWKSKAAAKTPAAPIPLPEKQ